MRMFVNGIEVPIPTGAATLRIEVDPGGETVGPWSVDIVGGPLIVEGCNVPALDVRAESTLNFLGSETDDYAKAQAALVPIAGGFNLG